MLHKAAVKTATRGPASRPGQGPANPSRRSLDDELEQLRKADARTKATIDDELDALKRKMRSKKKP